MISRELQDLPSDRTERIRVLEGLMKDSSTPVLGSLSVDSRDDAGRGTGMISGRGFDGVELSQGEDCDLGSYAQLRSADPTESAVYV